MPNEIKVGDVITYRPTWGTAPARKAVITEMAVTMEPREREGLNCQSCSRSLVEANRVVFGLDDGHWCYSDQIVL